LGSRIGPGGAGLRGCRRAEIEAPQADFGVGIGPGVACSGAGIASASAV